MSEQCKYMRSAYPVLAAEDTCSEHTHSRDVFSLARSLAAVFQQENPTDEQIAWFLNDAQAIVNDYTDSPFLWRVERDPAPKPSGIAAGLLVNGVQYVTQDSDWEPSVPERRSTYLTDRDLTEEDIQAEDGL